LKNLPSVALVSRSNALGGGASRIAEELGEWLLKTGCQVSHFCAFPHGTLKPFQAPLYSQNILGKLSRATHRLTRRFGFNEIFPAEFLGVLARALRRFDIVHFHDLNLAVSPLSLGLAARTRAVVFTAHDCSAFTGGCTYPMGCRRYEKRCGKCPQLTAIGARFDLTPFNLGVCRWLARKTEIQYVFPSKWLREFAKRSVRFGREAAVIPNGFSYAGYDFQHRKDARRALGIRDEQRVILVAAHYLADPRKGVAFALRAIHAVRDLEPLVICVGITPQDMESRLSDAPFWLTGFVSDKRRLGLLYAAANVFLFTSLEDNLPIMVQESLAAGTPVVGFSAGGVSEIVEHGRTGWLCMPGDQEKLNQNLRDGLERDDTNEFGEAAQKSVRERFDVEEFGRRHLNLYSGLVK
jgi:glycosyltransferase involved in cell wall biosynthesis